MTTMQESFLISVHVYYGVIFRALRVDLSIQFSFQGYRIPAANERFSLYILPGSRVFADSVFFPE